MNAISFLDRPVTFAALPCLANLPRGHAAVRVDQPSFGEGLARGTYLAIDPRDRELVDGASYAVQWEGDTPRLSFVLARLTKVGSTVAWFVSGIRTAEQRVIVIPEISLTGRVPVVGSLTDGPYDADGLSRRIVGRIAGVLAPDGYAVFDLSFRTPDPKLGSQRVIDLDELPEQYAMTGSGDCLSPVYPHGSKLGFTTIERPVPGDFVALWRRPDVVQPGEMQAMIKRLRTPLPRRAFASQNRRDSDVIPTTILVETLNPPRTYAIETSQLMAVHKILGLAGNTFKLSPAGLRRLTAEQKAARAAERVQS